jgi:hypothetical protein
VSAVWTAGNVDVPGNVNGAIPPATGAELTRGGILRLVRSLSSMKMVFGIPLLSFAATALPKVRGKPGRIHYCLYIFVAIDRCSMNGYALRNLLKRGAEPDDGGRGQESTGASSVVNRLRNGSGELARLGTSDELARICDELASFLEHRITSDDLSFA